MAQTDGRAGPQVAGRPLVLGVDTAGSYHSTVVRTPPWSQEAFFAALAELGVNHVNFHARPITNAGERNAELTGESFAAMDRAARTHGLYYTVSIESPNFGPRAEITPGVNEYDQPGGRHFWLLRMAWLRPLLPPEQPDPRLLAVIYDEADHMQLSNNKYSDYPRATFDQPFFVDTHGLPLLEAYERLVAECVRIRTEEYESRVPLHTEQVWPDLFHIFARAGWTAAPKLLKEHFTPVVLSIALGAAAQYQDAGGRFWVSPDLWRTGYYPGHSLEALRSALMMGYWLGAEGIYVENVDYPGRAPKDPAAPPKRHPEAPPKGSLLSWDDAEHYTVTSYGRVLQGFARSYVPSHPRAVDWRTFRPRVAIVRLPDGGWGQFDAGQEPFPHGEAASRNRLLGNRDMPLDEAASEWLHVWPILTHGVVKDGAISYNNRMVYPEAQDFFVPLDRVGVFDHEVRGPVLDGVECFIVCGHALSQGTFDEIRRRVADGATCIIARRLYEACTDAPTLRGDWLVLDDFTDPALAAKLQPFLGPPDVARYRFADQTVEFHKGDKPDSISVRVVSQSD